MTPIRSDLIMWSFKNLPIRTKIASLFTAVLFLISCFIFFYFPATQKEQVTRALREQAEHTAQMLGIGVSMALEESQYDFVSRTLNLTRADSAIVYIEVRDEADTPLVSINPSSVEIPVHGGVDSLATLESDGMLHTTVPLRSGDMVHGRLTMGYSLADRDRELNRIRIACFLVSAGIFLVGILLSVYIARLITRPLRSVVDTAGEIGRSGRYDSFIEKTSTDEVGTLIGAFNDMIAKIQSRTEELEDSKVQLERSNTDLSVANERAERANQAKSAFLASMSHELRTPLNAILGFSQLMSRDSDITESRREDIEVITRSGEHLLGLINDILEMSKIEAGQTALNETSFNLHRLLEDIETMFRLRAENKGLQLLFEIEDTLPRHIRTDEAKLRQVLINLIGNALKFTVEGGVIVRAGESPDPESDRIRFEIEDTGPGVPPEELHALFQAFGQTETGKKSTEGTGLGLPISQKFVSLMGGEITVKSEVNRGTVFAFSVQFAQALAEEVVQETKPAKVIGIEPGQPVHRILIVEDRPDNRRLLVKMLSPMGFDVKEAANGKEGVELWESWDPHLIWMDMRMPVMDGFEATRRIKEGGKGRETIVVALTASAFEEDRSAIMATGCDVFLRKPVREREIFDTLTDKLGVKFLYDGEDGEISVEGKSFDLSPESFAELPDRWVRDLHEASTMADSGQVKRLLEQIESGHSNLSEAVTRLVNDFQFARIMELTRVESD